VSRNTALSALITAQRRSQAARLRLAAVGGAVVSVAAVCLLGLSGWFITGAALAGVAGAATAQGFNYMMPSAIIRLLAILRTGARYIERVAGHEAALKALAKLRPQLFGLIAKGSPSSALALSSGEISARLVQDVDAVQTLFVRRSMPWSLGAGVASALLLVGLAAPVAALVLAATMVVTCVGAALLARRLADPAGAAVQVAVGAFKDRLSTLEAAAPELKAYALTDWARDEAMAAADACDQAQIALARAGGWLTAWQAFATAGVVVGVGVAAAGAPSPMIALALLAAVMGMESAAGLFAALHQNGAAAEALNRLEALSSDEAPVQSRTPTSTALSWPILGAPLSPPSRLCLIGASGAGKTTLVERLIGLRDARPGEMRIGDIDLTDIAPADRRPLFAYAAQDVRLLDGTIRQNLLMAGPADDAALWAALEDAALADRVRAEPLGLDAPVGPNGERLSGGERRRLGLARAFLRDAPWLVLDEPTEGLDPATEAQVLQALDARLTARAQGLILISHQSRHRALCDQVMKVDGIESDGGVRLSIPVSGARSDLAVGDRAQLFRRLDPEFVQRQHPDQA
jgi:ATP-binding cassette subfamily C protein CydC